MKKIFFRYPKLLISLSLLVSALLQFAWLRQLYQDQKENLEQEITTMVSRTAQEVRYYGITDFANPGNLSQIRQLYLSPQWEQLTQAFENMKLAGIRGTATVDASPDSTIVIMQLRLTDSVSKSTPATNAYNTGMTDAELKRNDSISLAAMKQKVVEGLHKIGISNNIWYRVYEISSYKIVDSTIPIAAEAGYTSNRYSYNVQNVHSYQLCLKAITPAIIFRMRYYLVSCLLMLTLTAVAFYVIYSSLKKQQLYADAKTDFSRNMTHEFKTPIATATVALESIGKYNLAKDPAKLQSYLDISLHELERLDLMVEKVLTIGKDQDTGISNEFQLTDVQPIITQVANSMQVQVSERSGILQTGLSAEPCFVYGDPLQIANILYTLVDNAIKYNSGAPVISIACSYTDKEITIAVSDNGPGIPDIYHTRIFDKYFRIPLTDEVHEVRGSGLGLYYVQQVVKQHKGSIALTSSLTEGSKFTINIPRAEI